MEDDANIRKAAKKLSRRDAPARMAIAYVNPIDATDASDSRNAGSHSPVGYRISVIGRPVGHADTTWKKAGTRETIRKAG